jgi:UDP-4-amino-4,6-dideoxy-N-acetyl-beta-L-altrosamine transaminase
MKTFRQSSKAKPQPEAFLPYGRQQVDTTDQRAVAEVLASVWLTCGPKVEEFERALAKACGARHAVAVSNGTAALHVALLAAGVGSGQRVLTTPNTFVASANCAAYVGATPDFADIDPVTLNLSPASLEQRWRDDVRAVVAVDFAGYPCDMPAIAKLARRRGAAVIEDAAHALGTRFRVANRWHKVGGHPWADLTTLSFHPVKTITTGEGGAILTNDDKLAARCRQFRSHGIVRDTVAFQFDPDTLAPRVAGSPAVVAPWYYEMQALGFNYRITDIQCALGISQLAKLSAFIKRRQEVVDCYNKAFAKLSHVRRPVQARQPVAGFEQTRPSWHLYVLQLDFAALGWTRGAFMQALRARGIGSQVHYIPVHLQPFYRATYGYAPGLCPVAEAYYRCCLSLPLYGSMSDADIKRVVAVVTELIGQHGRM